MQDTASSQCIRNLIRMYQLLEHSLEVNRIEVWTIGHNRDRRQPVPDVIIEEPETIGPTLGK